MKELKLQYCRQNDNICNFCGSSDVLVLYPTSSLTGQSHYICQCNQCRFYSLAPCPTAEELAQAYDISYYGAADTKFPRYIELVLDYFRKGRSRRIQKFVSPPAKVLDIGCGNGRFLGYLIPHGYEAYGFELPGKSAERAAAIPGLKLSTEPLAPESFSENYFDAISLWHVFEHLTEPQKALDIIDTILQPGGYLFLSLPNIESIQSRLFKGKWLHLDPPKHLFFPAPKTLIAELEKRGYALKYKTFFSLEQNLFGIQQSLLNCFCRKREVLFEALKDNSTYLRDISPVSIFFQKLFYILTFPVFCVLAAIEAVLRKGGTMEMVFQKQ
ncbi:MAG: class I SAM-dependent methyltransferase [Planctomycetota bacterium]